MSKWQRFLCNFLGWHKPSARHHDGCSFVSKCQGCCKRIIQDSQGGWFSASRQDEGEEERFKR